MPRADRSARDGYAGPVRGAAARRILRAPGDAPGPSGLSALMPRLSPAPPALAWCAALLVVGAAQAQVRVPDVPLYVSARGGLVGYEGDLGTDFDGFGGSAEAGYEVDDRLDVAVAFWSHDVPVLLGGYRFDGRRNVQGTRVYVTQLLARYRPTLGPVRPFEVAGRSVAPFVEGGVAVVSGQATEDERNNGPGRDDVFGFGPVVGAGVEAALTDRVRLALTAQSTVVLPDVALDGADPSAFADEPVPPPGATADGIGYDVLTNLGAAIRFSLRSPYVAARVEALACPTGLVAGETGPFFVETNAEATGPVDVAWDWGDGAGGTGVSSSHAFAAPGTYTVTATASNRGGGDAEACVVTVVEPPRPPALAACAASAGRVDAGQTLTVDATATDADAVAVDWGDGTTSTGLPAEHAYAGPGTYDVAVTATNEVGSDACALTVAVGDPFCTALVDRAEPAAAFAFGYGEPALTADARGQLDAALDGLARCPSVCALINGYSDGTEPGGARDLSRARAEAARLYLVGQGVDAERVLAVGRGEDPASDPKADPGPGDVRARRGSVVLVPCARL